MKFEKLYKGIILLFILSIPMMPIFTINIHYLLGFICIAMYFIDVIIRKKIIKFNIFELMYTVFIIFSILRIDEKIVYSANRTLFEYNKDSYYMIKNMIFSFYSIMVCIRVLYSIYKDMFKTVEVLGKTFFIGTVIVSFYCIVYEYFIIGDIQRLGMYVFANEYGTRITYTHDITISLFFIMYNIFNKKGKRDLLYLVLFLMILMILLSGTRKLIIALILFIIIYQLFNNKKDIRKIITYATIFIISLPIVYYLMMNIDFLYNLYGNRIESIIQEVVFEDGEDDSAIQRNRMMDKAMEYFKEEPIVGIGTNGFKYRFENDSRVFKYSHNNYTELLCNVGIIGSVIYYSSIFLILLKLIRKDTKNSLDNFFIASIITLLILDIWNVCYYRIQFLLIYELAGLYILINNKNKNEVKNNGSQK